MQFIEFGPNLRNSLRIGYYNNVSFPIYDIRLWQHPTIYFNSSFHVEKSIIRKLNFLSLLGILLILSEFRFNWVLRNFYLISFTTGRGIFTLLYFIFFLKKKNWH